MAEPTPTIAVLDYGLAAPARWRAWLRLLIATVILFAIAVAIYAAAHAIGFWLERRAGYRVATVWYQQARTSSLPAGTLLYTERPADFGTSISRTPNDDGTTRAFVSFTWKHPLLRMLGYHEGGVPMLYDDDVLYVHEHPQWAMPRGARPKLFCVSYRGLDARGRPKFFSTAYELADPAGTLRFPFMGAVTTVQAPTARSLANLRIFAGAPDPADPTRFSLPFTCDGGAGRFEFQTDVDVRDGGQLAPSVTIAWDDAPTTTRSGAPDVFPR